MKIGGFAKKRKKKYLSIFIGFCRKQLTDKLIGNAAAVTIYFPSEYDYLVKKTYFVQGEYLAVKNIPDSDFSARLDNLGITEGCPIYIKKVSSRGGPLIISARRTLYAVRQENLASVATAVKYENSFDREPELRQNDTLQQDYGK